MSRFHTLASGAFVSALLLATAMPAFTQEAVSQTDTFSLEDQAQTWRSRAGKSRDRLDQLSRYVENGQAALLAYDSFTRTMEIAVQSVENMRQVCAQHEGAVLRTPPKYQALIRQELDDCRVDLDSYEQALAYGYQRIPAIERDLADIEEMIKGARSSLSVQGVRADAAGKMEHFANSLSSSERKIRDVVAPDS